MGSNLGSSHLCLWAESAGVHHHVGLGGGDSVMPGCGEMTRGKACHRLVDDRMDGLMMLEGGMRMGG